MRKTVRQIFKRLGLLAGLRAIRTQIDLEREWLRDLLRGGGTRQTIRETVQRIVGLPGRMWCRLIAILKPGSEAGTSSVGFVWLRRILPIVAVALLFWATYNVVPQQTTFEQFDIFTTAPQQQILIVHDSTDTFGELAYANTVQALDYAHLTYDDIDLVGTTSWPDLSQYSAVLFVTELLGQIDQPQAEKISNYVADGGGVAVVYRGWNPHLASLFGIEVGSEWPALLVESEGGLNFLIDFFPGVKGLIVSPEVAGGHVPYDVQLQPDAEVIATSISNRPLAWLNQYGQGRALFWNTALLAAKDTRGLIVQSVSNVQRVSVLPIANVATIQIDDFPAGFPDEQLDPINTEYAGISTVEFYSQVWYPDIISIARRFGLAYTFLIPFNYNNQVTPPFNFQEWEHSRIRLDGQDVPYGLFAAHMTAQEGELGLHGYNHIPLTLDNWSSESNMVQALQSAMERWDIDNLGDPPTSYVPPHNRYDEAGARALTQAIPSLETISGLYNSGLFKEGGNREFGPEPWNLELFVLPRATSGYNMSPARRLAMLSELGTMGVWTHFIHPDDVFDTPKNEPGGSSHRNQNGWFWRGDYTGEKNGLFYRFLRWLNFVQTYYPWLRYVHTDEAREIMQTYLDNQVTVALKPYQISIHSTAPTFFQVRINDDRRVDLNALDRAQFVHIYHGEGYTIYTLRGIAQEVNLDLLIPKVGE